MNRSFALTPEEVQQFERDGFIGPFNSHLDVSVIDRGCKFLDEMIANMPDHPIYGRFSVRDLHLCNTDLMQIFAQPAMVHRLQSLAGDDLVLWRSKAFLKKPAERALGWHQEWGYFDGEEIGNHIPSLKPKVVEDHWWNLTVWVALNDVTMDMGPVQFVRGSHLTRYPWEPVPLTESAFFHDPFLGVDDKETLIERTRDSRLVLDINTAHLLKDVDLDALNLEQLKDLLMKKLSEMTAKLTLPFEIAPQDLVSMPVKKGQFFIFTERTMHGSPANTTNRNRFGINARVTTSDTLIYPGRLKGEYIDGSNLNIKKHRTVLLCGQSNNPDNALVTAEELCKAVLV